MSSRPPSRSQMLCSGDDHVPPPRPVAAAGSPEVVENGVGLARAPWRALCPTRVLELHNPDLRSLRRLPPGTAVALVTDGPLNRLLLRRRARMAGIRVDRELVVLPSTSAPLVVLDDNAAAVRHFWSGVAAVPPGVTWAHAPASLALTAVRRLPWQVTTAVAPGRVLVGVRQ
jgi:hypothetical protein